MPGVPSSSYSEDIVSRTKDFTGREWAFQRIDDWLQSDAERVFLITGGPGTGKTALAARLVQMSLGEEASEEYPSLGVGFLSFAHFCQAFNDPTLIPLRFIESLSKHLANRYPPFREALLQAGVQNVTIIPTVVVGSADRVTGVVIEELRIGDLSVREAFDRLVRKPFEQLYSEEPLERIVILVDSLDEAQTIEVSENIMTLIADITDHSADLPDNVRFLLTSRPDPRVMSKIGKRSLDLVLDLIVDAPDDVNDVREYAYRRLRMLHEPRRNNFATRVAEAAEGNFLYVRYLLDDLIPDIERVEDLGKLTLPEGLDDHYRLFIEREITRNQERWEDYYRPLLGVISVARGDGFDREQLAKVTGLKQSKTDDILRACRQYLSGGYPEGPFRIYHQSFREFLLSNSEYPVYPVEAHEEVNKTYLSLEMKNWDKYGWRYLPFHLSKAERTDELRLLLLNYEWMQSKVKATGLEFLLTDYDLIKDNHVIELIQKTLRLSIHAIALDTNQLAGQLLGRLSHFDDPLIKKMINQINNNGEGSWLKPLTPNLVPPGLLRGVFKGRQEGHSGTVRSVAISPNGKFAISAGNSHTDQTIRIWDLQKMKNIFTWNNQAIEGGYTALAIDNLNTALTTYEKEIRIWDYKTGNQLFSFAHPTNNIVSASISENGMKAAMGTDNGDIGILDVGTHLYRWIKTNLSSILVIRITSDGQTIVGGTDNKVFFLDTESGLETSSIETNTGLSEWSQNNLTLSPNEKIVSFGNPLKIWDIQNATIDQISDPNLGIFKAISSDGTIGISSCGRELMLVNHKKGFTLTNLLSNKTVSAVALTPSGDRAISSDFDHDLQIWDLYLKETFKSNEQVGESFYFDGYIDNGKIGVFRKPVANTFSYILWDLEEDSISNLVIERKKILKHFSKKLNKSFKLKLTKKMEIENGRARELVFSLDGKRAISGTWKGEKPADYQESVKAVEPDYNADLKDHSIQLWDYENEWTLRLLPGHTTAVTSLAISSDGRKGISGCAGRLLRVWNLDVGKEIGVLEGHNGIVWSVSITPDGTIAASASEDCTIKVWDLTSLDKKPLIATFSCDYDPHKCHISPDGFTVIVDDTSHQLNILKLIHNACAS